MKKAGIAMKQYPELRPVKWDALVVLVIAALAIALAARPLWQAQQDGTLHVVISIDGEEVERAALDAYCAAGTHTYESCGYTLTVQAADGRIRVAESSCPNGDCVRSGAISRAGQSIVCLPGRVAITLAGAADEYDLIAG